MANNIDGASNLRCRRLKTCTPAPMCCIISCIKRSKEKDFGNDHPVQISGLRPRIRRDEGIQALGYILCHQGSCRRVEAPARKCECMIWPGHFHPGTPMNMNAELDRLHRILMGLSMVGTFFLTFYVVQNSKSTQATVYGLAAVASFLIMPIPHSFAAKGARDGRRYGVVISRIVGIFWLFGFPVGTIIGTYLLWKGRNWQAAALSDPTSGISATPASSWRGFAGH
jgi:hypothetical protein